MGKILVIGAGGQGGPCASILSRIEDVSEIVDTEVLMTVFEGQAVRRDSSV